MRTLRLPCLLWIVLLGAAMPPSYLAARQRPPPSALQAAGEAKPEVRALLERAAKEPPAAALATLAEAETAAAQDAASLHCGLRGYPRSGWTDCGLSGPSGPSGPQSAIRNPQSAIRRPRRRAGEPGSGGGGAGRPGPGRHPLPAGTWDAGARGAGLRIPCQLPERPGDRRHSPLRIARVPAKRVDGLRIVRTIRTVRSPIRNPQSAIRNSEAQLVNLPGNSYYMQVRITLPVEETDGEHLRIAVAAETTAGLVSDREILRLRRPEATARRGALRVLAIGVSNYEKLPKLRYAAKDARALGTALGPQGWEGRLYSRADVTLLTEREATLTRLRQALRRFTAAVRPGETLVLALSGHGVKEGERYYFAPVGLDPGRMATTGLPWKEVLALLQGARRKAKAVWVLADCCRAGPGSTRVQQATGHDLKRGVEDGGNLAVCTASAGDTPSYESEGLRHGIFTQAWLEALRGEAPEVHYQETARGRVLDLAGLQSILNASVNGHARKAGVRQRVEFPRLEGSFSPSMPLFVALPGP